jgi:hypothetical protein
MLGNCFESLNFLLANRLSQALRNIAGAAALVVPGGRIAVVVAC